MVEQQGLPGATGTPPPPLPTGYYLHNFQTVLQDVGGRYGDLLHPEERARIDRFLRLPEGARRLYVRMLTRQGPWFRCDRFHYPEITDVPGAVAALLENGFGLDGGHALPAERIALLRKEEIMEALAALGEPLTRGMRREELALRLAGHAEAPRCLAAWALVSPDGLPWVRLLFFLFFGNGERDLTDFVLADLGQVRYEDYRVDPAERLFRTRPDVDFLLTLEDLRETFEAGQDLPGLTALLRRMEPNPGVRQQRRFHRLLNDVGQAWERRGEPAEALACYALSERPPARERTARILAAQARIAEASALAAGMAAEPRDVGEARFARTFLKRLAGRDALAAAWCALHPEPEPVPELRLSVPRHPSGSVEAAALEAARQQGWDGFFTENTLWNALFGLAFWDELFAPVPGAFQHRLQSAPADLGSPEFHARRSSAIAARLERLAAPGALLRELPALAERKRGIANAFVNWRGLSAECLEAALACLPPAAILAVLRTMAPNPTAFRSGFPDLFLYRRATCQSALWEVKGPGDALRPEQERWLSLFHGEGLDARVVWVKYAS